MADNTVLNAGTGGDTIATDDIAGVKYQRVKISVGADGSATDVSTAAPLPVNDAGGSLTVDNTVLSVVGGGTEATAQRVTIASDSTGVLSVDDNGASLTVDGTVAATQSGTWNVTNVSGTVSLPTGASTAANQSTIIGHLDGVEGLLTTIDGDTGALAAAVKAEDAAHSSADTGIMALAVRRDADTSLVGADNDYAPLQVNSTGSLKVAITAGAGSGGTSIADGASFTRNTTSLTPVGGVVETSAPTVTNGDAVALSLTTGGAVRVDVASGGITGRAEDSAAAGGEDGVPVLAVRRDSASSGVSADGDWANLSVDSTGALRVTGGGGGTQFAEDAAHTTADVGTVALAVRRDTAAVGSGTDGDYSTLNVNSTGRLYTSSTVDAALPAGTNNIGDVDILTIAAGDNNIGNVDVVTLPALPAGTNNIGDVDVLTIAAGTNAIGNVGLIGRTTGGLTIFRSIDLDETEEEAKATAGQVFGWYIYNANAAARYVKFYNATAANVTVGTTTPVLTLPIPPTSGANVFSDVGIAFSTAITVAATTGVADTDTGAPGANEVIINLFYA
jgi:hypothetical protein